MVPFESFGMISYSHSIVMAVSLAVSTQYTNVTDIQPDRQTPHVGMGAFMHSIERQKPISVRSSREIHQTFT